MLKACSLLFTKTAHLRGQWPRNSLRVLLYHNITGRDQAGFARQMAFLKSKGRFVDVGEFEAMMAGNRPIIGRNYLLTFDDGFKSNKRVADEVLAREDIKALFFIPTQFMGITDSHEAGDFIARRIFDEQRSRESVTQDFEAMTWADLSALVAAGHGIGSHTVTHPRCTLLNKEELERELAQSKTMLEARLGVPIDHLAFPFGNIQSLSETSVLIGWRCYRYVHTAIRGENLPVGRRMVFRDGFDGSESDEYLEHVLNGGFDLAYWRARRTVRSWWAAGKSLTTGAQR